jgi:glycosyltransferase involved in cell wall biosynthesis
VKKVAALMTHPTQYHSPWFKGLARRPEIDLQVYYCIAPTRKLQGAGFGLEMEWDIPLLEGYSYSFLRNVSRKPGWHFSGADTPEIADIVNSRRFDVWMINGWTVKSEWQAIQSCWREHVPMFIRGDSNLLARRSFARRAATQILHRRWIPRFSCYLTVGRLNEQYYEHFGADPSRFVPVRHFVDNAWFSAQASAARGNVAEIRRRWGISPNSTVFLFVGKFAPHKRPLDAIRAFETACKSGLDMHLLMVGDGALRPTCEEYARVAGIPVTFAGFLNQTSMPTAYASADVLVLPSTAAETWGLVVNEAMASGVPAIVSQVVGCGPDLVTAGETGQIFPVGDWRALARILVSYASSRDLVTSHSQAARHRVSGYSVSSAVENTIKAIESFG